MHGQKHKKKITVGYPTWISPVMLQNKTGIWNQCWNAYQEENNIPI